MIAGPRAVGKTTLLRALGAAHDVPVIDLAQDEVLEVARDDPEGFLAGRAEPVLLDEFQRLPSLLRVMKRSVDRNRRTGAFVVTGSTTRLLPPGSETLTGRSHDMVLWGFSQGELLGQQERFVERLFDEPSTLLGHRSQLDRAAYVAAVARGGFPEAIARDREDARRRWFAAYARRLADRDLAELVDLRQPRALSALLRVLAARTAQILNLSDVARDLSVGRELVRTYISLLEAVYVVSEVPAYSRNRTSRVARHPKLHVADSGLATALCRLSEQTLRRSPQFGSLLETFVVGEVTKQLSWSAMDIELFHYRHHNGPEVDLVLEAWDGRVVGIEVKAATAVNRADASGLRHLAAMLGPDFVHGVVLYTGTESIRLSDDARITAHPVSVLWA